jgi:hypothetical protein
MVIEEFEPVTSIQTLDAGDSTDAGFALDAGTPPIDAGIEISEQIESMETPTQFNPSFRVYGWMTQLLGIDTRFDSPRGAPLAENVFESKTKMLAGVDIKLTAMLRAVLEVRAQLRLVTQRDFDRAKGLFEPMVGDAFLDLYTQKVDLRIGFQRIIIGANAGLAGSDILNARDLRDGLFGNPEDGMLSVFAIRAQGEVGKITYLAAYVPFFTPNRYFMVGQDESLIQPALGQSIDNTRLEPSVEDFSQERILETKRPAVFLGDVALRAAYNGRVKLGISWVWANEKMPRVRVDSELANVLSAQSQGRAVDNATAVSVSQRLQNNETLFTGVYARTHVFSVEASTLISEMQLDVDVSFSPRQTFFDASFSPIDKSALTWVVGISQAGDSPFVYGLTYTGIAIPNVASEQELILLEPATARGANRTAFFHLFAGFASYQFFNKKFEVSLRAIFEPVQRSFALSPQVAYVGIENLRLSVGGDIYEGPKYSPLGYFGRNDRVTVNARWEF